MTDRPLEVELHHQLGRITLDLRFSVGRGTLALIGTSGAGKTSVLLAIAGILRPDEGRILSGGRPLLDTWRRVDVAPEQRRVGVVLQNGALFPHLNIAQNVAFGLRPRPHSRRESGERVGRILERFAIGHLASSRPDRVSGGERQRVALARAVATSPDVLLLDEPLSALDAVTKSRVAAELSRTLAELRLPTILVSHDFGDVAGLADRVAVMDAGKIVQMGTTAELVRAPETAFVAAFVGTNYFAGTATRVGDSTEVDLDGGARVVSPDAISGRVGVVVQPSRVSLGDPVLPGRGANVLVGPVARLAPRGEMLRVFVASTPPVVADVPAAAPEAGSLAPGVLVAARWPRIGTRLVPCGSRAVGE